MVMQDFVTIYILALSANPVFAWVLLLLAFDQMLIELLHHIRTVFPKVIKNLKSLSKRGFFSVPGFNGTTYRDSGNAGDLPRMIIIIPTYNEASVIGGMLLGNIRHLDYPRDRYQFWVGVYPNDIEGCALLTSLAKKYPNIRPVINPKEGPTSKGQMLNVLIGEIENSGERFDALVMHDAEDFIHPDALKTFAKHLPFVPYLQLPVLPFVDSDTSLISEGYADEFLQWHIKEAPLRSALGASVPSAGVGTAIRADLVSELRRKRNGEIFKGDTVTEDYELGVRIGHQGFGQRFVLERTDRGLVATREYFPKFFDKAVKQKTRWTVGISFQGHALIGWVPFSNWIENFYLMRDRKTALMGIVSLIGLLYGLGLGATYLLLKVCGLVLPEIHFSTFERIGLLLSLGYGFYLAFERVRLGTVFFGWRFGLGTMLRWPLATAVNGVSAIRAVKQYAESLFYKKTVRWEKTDHYLPAAFSTDIASGGPT